MIVQTQTTSFKVEVYKGVHNLLTDTIKIALYTANADLSAATTIYTASEEVVGVGYTAGGNTLTGATVEALDTVAYVNFNNATWNPAAFTTRGALIYNASKGNKAIAVLNFGNDKTCTSTFTVTMPANTNTTALIRYI